MHMMFEELPMIIDHYIENIEAKRPKKAVARKAKIERG